MTGRRVGRIETYSFELDRDDLDAIRSMCMAAEMHHLDRARYYRTLPTASEYATVIEDEERSAVAARSMWALLAGVERAKMEGRTPVGPIERDKLLGFLGFPRREPNA